MRVGIYASESEAPAQAAHVGAKALGFSAAFVITSIGTARSRISIRRRQWAVARRQQGGEGLRRRLSAGHYTDLGYLGVRATAATGRWASGDSNGFRPATVRRTASTSSASSC